MSIMNACYRGAALLLFAVLVAAVDAVRRPGRDADAPMVEHRQLGSAHENSSTASCRGAAGA